MRVIGIAGVAGSGKGTAANVVHETLGSDVVEWAFADPIKGFCGAIFNWGFERLYGSTEHRNAPDDRYPAAAYQRNGHWERASNEYTLKRVEFAMDLATWSHRSVHVCLQTLDEWWFGLWTSAVVLTPRRALQTLGTEMGRTLNPDIWVSVVRSRIAEGGDRVVVVPDVRFNNEFKFFANDGHELWHLERPDAPEVPEHASEVDMHGPLLRELRTRHYVNGGTLDDLRNTIRSWL